MLTGSFVFLETLTFILNRPRLCVRPKKAHCQLSMVFLHGVERWGRLQLRWLAMRIATNVLNRSRGQPIGGSPAP